MLLDKTKEALNGLSDWEVSNEVSFAYHHEILWYGIEAVAHVHFMCMAKDITEGKLSKEEFIKKYDLSSARNRLTIPLKKIEEDGIFIPQHAHDIQNRERAGRRIAFFDGDYINRIYYHEWDNQDYAASLVRRAWTPEDLEDPKLIKEGLRFGKDLWKTCVEGFEESKTGTFKDIVNGKRIYNPPQPQKVTKLAEKLIEYYSAIVNP